MIAEADRIVTHLFAALSPAYVGWRWAVTVTRAARAKVATVSECLLLPGPDSLLAPEWLPWTDRVRPGDLRAGDLMPAAPDDERLVPAVAIAGEAGLLDWELDLPWYLLPGVAETTVEPAAGTAPGETATVPVDAESAEAEAGAAEAPAAEAPAGPGQPELVQLRPARVLSVAGRDQAAVRWYTGDRGPRSSLALSAPARCLTCGFLIRLSGPLGRVFGACANEYAPDDGKVVSIDHGCGAHSEGEAVAEVAEAASPVVDEVGYDMMNAAQVPESVLETLDHELL